MKISQMVKALGGTMKNQKTSAYDTPAKVLRVDGSTVYVHIPGGAPETPVRKTINCQKGDTVQVRVGNGTAWLTGNATAPPTDDRLANRAVNEINKTNVVVSEATQQIAEQASTIERHYEVIERIDTTAVTGVVVQYAKGTSQTEPPTTGWSSDSPVWESGKYIWQRTVTTIDGEQIVSNVSCIQGAKGEQGIQGIQGIQGETGATGNGISSHVITYGISDTATTQPSSWNPAAPATIANGKWLWTRTVTSYTDGTSATAFSKSYVGTNGQDGQDGTSVTILGSYSTLAELQAAHPTGNTGDSYMVAGDLYVWNGSAWQNVGQIQGPQGVAGADGTSITISSIEYGISDTASAQPTSWSTTAPTTIAEGKWLWVRTNYSDGGNATTKSYVGTDGADGTNVYIQSASKVGSITTVVIADDDGNTHTLTIADGEDGADGINGTNGLNGYVHVAWANSADGSQDFSTTVSTGKTYLGTYTDNVAADSTRYQDYSWSLIKGAKGDTGVGIASIAEYYAVNNSVSAPDDSAFTLGVKNPTVTNRYLWNREYITFTDGSHKWLDKRVVAVYGQTGQNGSDGVGIASIVDYYARNNSTTAPATSAFSTTVVLPNSTNKYVWNFERITYTNNNVVDTDKRIIGTYGEKGDKGDQGIQGVQGIQGIQGETGRGISSITAEYYLSTSNQSPVGGEWVTTPPSYQADCYYWTRSKIIWTDSTTPSYTTAVLDTGITDANSQAYQALRKAGTAEDVANATKQYFWEDESGVHIASEPETPEATRNVLFNTLGMLFRRGANYLLTLVTGTNPAVNIYDGQGNADTNVCASFSANGTRIGKENDSNVNVSPDGIISRHGGDGMPYFSVIRDESGTSEQNVVETFEAKVTGAITYITGLTPIRRADVSVNGINRNYPTNEDLRKIYLELNAGDEVRISYAITAVKTNFTYGFRGYGTESGNFSSSFGWQNTASGDYSHAEGASVIASDKAAHAEGMYTVASNPMAHAEGMETHADGYGSHAEGGNTRAYGLYAHAEGLQTYANGSYSHAEGENTQATSRGARASGISTKATEYYSRASGMYSEATGENSNADGYYAMAKGTHSHAFGYYTIANRAKQTVLGRYNKEDTQGSGVTADGKYAFIVGNGTDSARSNAFAVDWSGNTESNSFIPTNHTAPAGAIGEYIKSEPSAKSCATGGYYNIGSVRLTAGVWVIVASALFTSASTANGIRRMFMTQDSFTDGTTTAPSNLAVATYDQRQAIANHAIYTHSQHIINPGIERTYYLVGYHNQGANLNITGRIYAVRIA